MSRINVLIEKYIGEGEIYKVPMRKNKKKTLETALSPEKRTLKNLPRYSDGSQKADIKIDWRLKNLLNYTPN